MAIIIDPIADMFVRIKNAIARKYHEVLVPHSKTKIKILEIFKQEGYIVDFEVIIDEKTKFKEIKISLKYKGLNQNQSAISGIKRVSKPSLKVYVSAANVPRVLSGYGTAIISTSKGLLTDKQARKANIGGEVLAFIW
ncbi:30S ribosomal protein S8 [Metamycoplasma hyosynoviae]|uniref:Small ribosomal subunit protein uS8 n=1 Tax=Metamycoplasma hyosynoviae TaxID=29559 RepID=A0A4P1QFY9_9BACT|nr:30S ribosomal protein S8 [Metamycoplasma hyosynoviae]ASI53919.1 30S ribosomal protein S8 [Metamycoplasma hyosynoviae]MDC8913673.1 30S ribosomal protein S8 [Metamycoplasma hyosynoviae]MDC8914347.1 30S ribosomal protein S8 [Metamycoplasma hyosynoviae]MDC8915912.1 30S ribosomal protein S8 [Metamycoplasma hyosynoviae]MDC8916501.1 30S ribosomal protein S8 [Metamycoplasma hyosynoviae]